MSLHFFVNHYSKQSIKKLTPWTLNSLPYSLTSVSSLSTFRRQLKTLLFTRSSPDSFHRTWLQGRGSAHLELTTIRRYILPYCGHLQTTPQDPSVQTVLTWHHQRLCVFGLYGAIQMLLLLLLLFSNPRKKFPKVVKKLWIAKQSWVR